MLKDEPLWHAALFYGCLTAGAAFLVGVVLFFARLFIAIGRMMGGGE